MDISHLLNELNDHQREAVTTELVPLRILAGAGSGKTRVLVYRIAWLIEVEGFSPFNILAVTFTNKAAKEMQHRIAAMIGPSANNMWLGTFHSTAHRLLRLHWREANLIQNFQVLDSEDQLRLIRRVIKNLQLDDTKWPPKQAQWFINSQKEEGRRLKDLAKPQSEFEQVMHRILHHYEEACAQSGLVDFSELLLRSFELFKTYPEMCEHYRNRFRYILVDEFQDTNRLQYAWLKLLAGDKSMLMIVGDDDQSIYSWRGACVDNMHKFEKEFPGTKTIRLEQNYRSTGHILKAANHLISKNEDRLGKNLWTSSGEGELISVYAAFNEMDEARFIVDQIKQSTKGEFSLNDCAVLYRSNAQSRVLEEALIQAGVPYRIYGGLRFFERAEIKDALAYLRLVENNQDDPALERVINTPTRGIGERTVDILRETARDNQSSLWEAAQFIINENLLPLRAHNALENFLSLITRLTTHINELALHEQIEQMLKHSSLLDHYAKEKGEKGQARLENLEELVSAAQWFESDDETLSKRTAFLSHAALEAGDTQAAAHQNCVQLMTAHSAKGLEFPIVFIAGLEEGLFPHQMSMDDVNGLQEERRLCYVAMTRAMKKLYLCYAESRFLYGKQKSALPSRFLHDLPTESLQEVRIRTRVSQPYSKTNERSRTKIIETDSTYRLGQSVMHEKFGEGVILNIEGSGAKARLQVNFSKSGMKWLMAEYANLTVA
ncbi:MAG: DNA helicase II [Verrucomicrobia bacterium RIFCSPHIGHO2_12_FULL_41_10]|nr:MAG: DNA helicase II [Verrucomicrobia bacterium RIFCSPHIGHO2_12_FULL_41_10]